MQFGVDFKWLEYTTVSVEKEWSFDMDDVSRRQQFNLNAMHGADVGVWVCEGSGLFLSPVLFMQALCPDPAPRSLFAPWKPATIPPRAFRKEGALPLVYSECGRLPTWPYYLHLFAPQAPVAEAIERESSLQDWSWTVPLIGIILIYDRKYDAPPGPFSFINRLFDRSESPSNTSLAWVQAQPLPYVIAALGYEDTPNSLQRFRKRYDLTADVPVISGPALVDTRHRTQGPEDSGPFSAVFTHQKLALDRDYARTVLDALLQQIEREHAA